MSARLEPSRRFCVAPMLDYTDRHFRYLLRLISRHAVLYTEMVTTGALTHGSAESHLQHETKEAPVALQLGGSDPDELARSADLAEAWGYQEVNLNVGCPSNRVQSGRFGACLMAEPNRVAECVSAMREACSLPITVKTRTGIDRQDSPEFLFRFVEAVIGAGVAAILVHARKAWLKGLNPKQNRTLPPLCYDCVYGLKREFPDLEIIVNGGVNSPEEGMNHLRHVDGVMVGRAIMDNPYLLSSVDALFYGVERAAQSRGDILARYLRYLRQQRQLGVPTRRVARHLTGLYHGQSGAKAWRRAVAQAGLIEGDPVPFLEQVARETSVERANE